MTISPRMKVPDASHSNAKSMRMAITHASPIAIDVVGETGELCAGLADITEIAGAANLPFPGVALTRAAV